MEVKEQIEALGKRIDEKIEKANGQAAEAGTIAKELKDEIKALTEKFVKMQEQTDKLETERNRFQSELKSEGKSLYDHLTEKFAANESFKAMQKSRSGFASIEFPMLKATMFSTAGSGANSLTGEVITPQMIPGVFGPAVRNTHVRQYIPGGTTTSNTIRYVQETAYNNNAAMVAEGLVKPESDLTFAAKDAPVRTLAHLFRVSKIMLDDIPYLASYIGMRGVSGLRYVEDAQILYGDGLGENLEGVSEVATVFAAGAITVPTPNLYDVLVAAANQTRVAEYVPSAHFLHPTDFTRMVLAKGSDGHYLFPDMRSLTPNILGVPAVQNTAVTQGEFFSGAFGQALQLFDRQGITIEMFDQDRDNVQKNLITIRIEERVALPIYRPDALVYGTFAAAITDLTPA